MYSAILPGHGAIISPKFFRYLDTLSELAICVPLTQITIPPAVYEEKQHEAKIAIPNIHSSPSLSAAFGVPLEDIMGPEGKKGPIPRVIRDGIQYLCESGLNDEGLFLRSQLLPAAQEAYESSCFIGNPGRSWRRSSFSCDIVEEVFERFTGTGVWRGHARDYKEVSDADE
ncbi:hypothetical protein D9758_014777 [Tetrapyrgos nigripes]|uniref:Uncharacterized protein n=1 Tax=Tetrapyrgos nigripes TaxID=182062 RepID=A0A8H5C4Y3_9AGAR|nr:hypothetical protein D9758_014777 [Tetrapyrgos nigripes]